MEHLQLELEKTNIEKEEFCKNKNDLEENTLLLSSTITQLSTDLETHDKLVKDLSARNELANCVAEKMSEAEDSSQNEVLKLSSKLILLEGDLEEQQNLCALEKQKVVDVLKEVELTATNMEHLQLELEKTNIEKEEFYKNKNDLEENVLILSSTITQLSTDLETSDTLVKDLSARNELANSITEKMSMAEGSIQNEVLKLSSKLISLEGDLEEQQHLYALEKQKVGDLRKEVELTATNMEHLRLELEKTNIEKKEFCKDKNDLEENTLLLSSTISQLSTDLTTSDTLVKDLSARNELANCVAQKMSEAEDSTQNEVLKLSSKLISLEGDLEEQQNLCALETQKVVDAFKEAEVTLQTALCNKASHDTELQVFNVEVARLSTEKEGLSTSLSEVKQELESYQAEKNKLLLELETVQKDSEENALHLSADLESKHNIAVQELNADIEDLLNEQDKMNIMLDEKQQELESCQAEQDASVLRLECSLKEGDEREKALISDTCSIEASYENQIQTLNEKMTHISNEKETFSTIVEGIQQELESCQTKQKASELELESFKKEHDMMLLSLTEKEKASISDTQAVEENYKSEIQSLIEKIDCISNEKKSFSDKLDEVQQALKSSISEQKALQLDLVSLKSEYGKLQEETGERIRLEQVENDTQEKKTTALATQNEELKTSVISLQGDLEEQQNLCALEKQKVVDAFKEVEASKQEMLIKEGGSFQLGSPSELVRMTEMKSLKADVAELQQLLSSSNQREEEAQSNAIAADEELAQKECQYEEMMKFASERDSVAHSAEEKVIALEKRLVSDDNYEEEQLLKDMELLMDEKLEVEAQLDAEISQRRISEQDLKTQMGKEQRSLVQEAESRMGDLRTNFNELKEELRRHKTEAQLAKEELEFLEDQGERDKMRHEKSDDMITKLQEQISSNDQSISCLQNQHTHLQEEYRTFKEHTHASKESLKEALEKKLRISRDEISSLRDGLHIESTKKESVSRELELVKGRMKLFQEKVLAGKQALLNEKDTVVSKLKEELARGKVLLFRIEAESITSKQETIHYKEQLRKFKKKNCEENNMGIKKAQQDAKCFEEKLIQREADYNSLMIAIEEKVKKLAADSDEINSLRIDLNTKNEEIKLKDSRLKYLEAKRLTNEEKVKTLAADSEEIKKLRIDLNTKNDEIKVKDLRLKYLEAKRLTKEKAALIKKCQDERHLYKEKMDEFQRQLLVAKQELSQLQLSNKENDHPKVSKSELSTLKLKNQTLDKKLRKYVAHCRHLEEEKNAIAAVMKNTMPDDGSIINVNKDFSGTIIQLCERLNALEEECDVLTQAEQKASSCLLELDTQQEANSNLQKNIIDTENERQLLLQKERETCRQLEDSKKQISIINEQCSKLKQIADSSQHNVTALEIEKTRQVTYLEKENLQLLEELNLKKKEVHKVMAERDMQQYGNNDDKSEEFSEMYSSFEFNGKHDDKENRNHSQEDKKNTVKECGTIIQGNTALSDMKNQLNISDTSICKPPSSIKPNRQGLGSGEGLATDENTAECNTN